MEVGITLFAQRPAVHGPEHDAAVLGARSSRTKPPGPGTVFNDFLNLFFFDKREGIGAVLKALESKGYFQSLAEPNLIAYNGQEASFLAGGEFPVPIVQGTTERGDDRVQGVRRAADVHADDCR